MPDETANQLTEAAKALKEIQDIAKLLKEEATKRAKEVATNPNTSEKKDKPGAWSTLSVAPYYREKYATEFKVVLDMMIEEAREGKFLDKLYPYSQYPGMSRSTLYQRINQSKRYLVDKMDPDHKYTQFLKLLTIKRVDSDESLKGVLIAYQRTLTSPDSVDTLKPVSIEGTVELPKKSNLGDWNDAVDTFLNEGKLGEQIMIKGITLSPEKQATLEQSLINLEGIIYRIKKDSIFVRKLTPEESNQV